MTIEEAKQIGGRRALVNHLIAMALWELVLIVQTMIEDPAYGLRILFYIQVNAVTIAYLLILLGAMYLCGRRAGRDILNNADGYLKTGIKYALLTSLVILIPFLAMWYFAGNGNFLWPVLFIVATLAAVWLITARQISGRIASEMES